MLRDSGVQAGPAVDRAARRGAWRFDRSAPAPAPIAPAPGLRAASVESDQPDPATAPFALQLAPSNPSSPTHPRDSMVESSPRPNPHHPRAESSTPAASR